MGLLKLTYLRLQKRRRVVGFMPSRLYSADFRQQYFCRPLDVSQHGIGIFTEDELSEKGDEFVFVLENYVIRLVRVFSLENPGLKVGFRHGFKVKDQTIDLEQLCIDLGYL